MAVKLLIHPKTFLGKPGKGEDIGGISVVVSASELPREGF
jgi:hypothetical protein